MAGATPLPAAGGILPAMSTATPPTTSRPARPRRREPAEAPPWADVQHYVFEGVSWAFYESVLRQVGDGPVRVAYDDGRLEIMSPLPEHERPKRAIGRLVEQLTLELDIAIASFGSTTFRRRGRRKGVEPDECYYIAHERQMRGPATTQPEAGPAARLGHRGRHHQPVDSPGADLRCPGRAGTLAVGRRRPRVSSLGRRAVRAPREKPGLPLPGAVGVETLCRPCPPSGRDGRPAAFVKWVRKQNWPPLNG